MLIQDGSLEMKTVSCRLLRLTLSLSRWKQNLGILFDDTGMSKWRQSVALPSTGERKRERRLGSSAPPTKARSEESDRVPSVSSFNALVWNRPVEQWVVLTWWHLIMFRGGQNASRFSSWCLYTSHPLLNFIGSHLAGIHALVIIIRSNLPWL